MHRECDLIWANGKPRNVAYSAFHDIMRLIHKAKEPNHSTEMVTEQLRESRGVLQEQVPLGKKACEIKVTLVHIL